MRDAHSGRFALELVTYPIGKCSLRTAAYEHMVSIDAIRTTILLNLGDKQLAASTARHIISNSIPFSAASQYG